MENKFEYTYSAPKNAEIEKIRKKYAPQTSAESKLEQIKKLDSSVESEAVGCALGIGIPGSLILGLGMSCCMVWSGALFVPGILIGCVGIGGVLVTYPLYHRLVRQDREKIAPEILRLSNELILENNI